MSTNRNLGSKDSKEIFGEITAKNAAIVASVMRKSNMSFDDVEQAIHLLKSRQKQINKINSALQGYNITSTLKLNQVLMGVEIERLAGWIWFHLSKIILSEDYQDG